MNRRVVGSVCVAAVLFLFTAPRAAHAQAAQSSMVAGFSVMEFDLAGVGTAPGMVVRASRALGNHVAVEGSWATSWLNEDFGKSTLFAPEAQLQYHWQVGSFRPYAGGGVGFAWRDLAAFGNSDVNLTLSAAGGTRFDLTDRLALLGELRLRGIKRNFAGSTSDFMGGLSWHW